MKLRCPQPGHLSITPALGSIALLLMLGCSVRPMMREPQALSTGSSPYDTLDVSVDAPEHVRQQAGYESTADALTAAHSSNHLQGVLSPPTSRQVSAIAKELSGKLVRKSSP